MSRPCRVSADTIAEALGRPTPTREQRAIIEAPLANTLVIAGAGSGKTETMAARVVWLVANGRVDPGEVLGLTFTRKAAGELATRLAARLRVLRRSGLVQDTADGAGGAEGEVAEQAPTVSTYHGYAGALVAEHGLTLGLEPDLRVLSEASAWQLAQEVVHAWPGDLGQFEKAEASAVNAVLALSGELGEHLRDVEAVREHLTRLEDRVLALPSGRRTTLPGPVTAAREIRAILTLVEAYQEAKAGRGVLDFGDQVALAARLVRDVPHVVRTQRGRHRVVLLDEFQDTSEAQLVLLSTLFAPAADSDTGDAADDPVSVTAVGDPNQGIYGWRGASAGALETFPQVFPDVHPDGTTTPATVRSLATTFRNDVAVLEVANAVAAPLREHTRLTVEALRPGPAAGSGTVEVARTPTQPEEVGVVGDWVQERRDAGPGTSVAVLCRTRNQIQPVVTELRDRGIPVQVVGLGGLLGTPLVRDLVAALGVADDPTRGPDVLRLLTGGLCRLGAADLDGLHAWLEHRRRLEAPERPVSAGAAEDVLHLGEVLEDVPPQGWADHRGRGVGRTALTRLRGLALALRRIRSVGTAHLSEVVRVAEQALGLDLEAAADPQAAPSWSRADLDAFAQVAADYADSADHISLGAFVAWLDAAEERERGLERPDLPAGGVDGQAVQILTVHAAKGLEWDAVAVPGLTERTFPGYRGGPRASLDDEGELVIGPFTDSGWLTGHSSLPYELRGDHDSLPRLELDACESWADVAACVEGFTGEVAEHSVREERRLAYVAFTRARHHLLLTAHVWSVSGVGVRAPSRFLREVRQLAPMVRERIWSPPPADLATATNPLLEVVRAPLWPPDRSAQRQQHAEAVAVVLADPLLAPDARPSSLGEAADRIARLAAEDPADAEEDALLVELLREQADQDTRRSGVGAPSWAVPGHLTTSDVVALAQDRERVLAQWRRPMPAAPAHAARRGTAFHAWVERHYRRAALLEPEELLLREQPLDDAPSIPDGDADPLADMQRHFLDSVWAGLEPRAIEVPVETTIGGHIVRGRIDAVFDDGPALDGAPGGAVVVDWKSGRPPSPQEAPAAALQLAAYRVAYARLTGLPLERVRGAFFHAAPGRTLWPDLPDVEDLQTLLARLLPQRADAVGPLSPSVPSGPLSPSSLDGMS